MLPIILEALSSQGDHSSGTSINKFFITMMGEIPAIFIALFLIDTKAFGRRNTMLLSHVLAAIMFFLAFVCKNPTSC